MVQIDVKEIWRWREGQDDPQQVLDELAFEEPLEIRVNGRPVSVTMRTPGHDAELAAGFLLSEGLIRGPGEIARIQHVPQNPEGLVQIAGQGPTGPSNVLNVELAPGVQIDFDRLTRHVFASSSCGLCGKATIDAVRQQFPPIRSAIRVRAQVLLELQASLAKAQDTFNRTGGLHAAMIFEAEGAPVVAREDVGRHNAVDKVLGYGLRSGLIPFDRQVLLISGRGSFEILQKALAGGLAVVAAVSAPSNLAVQFARENGITLIGFLRGERMNVYAGAERIVYR
jgi:FdhD protein